MRARYLNEKFSEDSDAVHDMGIGEPEYENLKKTYQELEDYMNFDVEDLEFGKVIDTLNYLRRISAYNVAMFFNRNYNFYVKIDSNNVMGGDFASGNMGKYKIIFSTSGPGKMISIAIKDKNGQDIVMKQVQKNYGNVRHQQSYTRDIHYEGSARTIHSLNNRFRNLCKTLKIDLSQYEK